MIDRLAACGQSKPCVAASAVLCSARLWMSVSSSGARPWRTSRDEMALHGDRDLRFALLAEETTCRAWCRIVQSAEASVGCLCRTACTARRERGFANASRLAFNSEEPEPGHSTCHIVISSPEKTTFIYKMVKAKGIGKKNREKRRVGRRRGQHPESARFKGVPGRGPTGCAEYARRFTASSSKGSWCTCRRRHKHNRSCTCTSHCNMR